MMLDLPAIACSCSICQEYCLNPGFFAPGQVEAVAEHLGISLQALFDGYLTAFAPPVGFRILAPKTTPTGCVFLKDGKCSIHAVKPLECSLAHHDREDVAQAIHDEIGWLWNAPEVQKQIGDLVSPPMDTSEGGQN